MPATVSIQSWSRNSQTNAEVWTAVTQVRFKTAANDTTDNTSPLIRPTSGETYSHVKAFKLVVSVPPSNNLSSLRFHRTTGMPQGITDFYGERAKNLTWDPPKDATAAQTTQASLPVPETATQLATTETFTTIGAGETGNMFGGYLYIQWRVSNQAVAGTTASVTYRWTFDEA